MIAILRISSLLFTMSSSSPAGETIMITDLFAECQAFFVWVQSVILLDIMLPSRGRAPGVLDLERFVIHRSGSYYCARAFLTLVVGLTLIYAAMAVTLAIIGNFHTRSL